MGRQAAKFEALPDVGKPFDNALAVSVRYMMGPKIDDKSMQEAADKYTAPEKLDILDDLREENLPS